MRSPKTPKAGATSDDDRASRRGIQSVEIGFRVLAAVAAESQPATLGAIAKRAGLSASQAHRYLASLIAGGMAHQAASSGRYELGPQAIQIGLAALARTDVFAEADPAIAAFTRDTGRSTLVAARGPLGPTIVRWHAGRTPVITSLAVGSVLPLLGSATGHAFLAFMGSEELAGAVETAKAEDARCGGDRCRRRPPARARHHVGVRRRNPDPWIARDRSARSSTSRAAPRRVATVMATPAFARADDEAIVHKLQSVCRSLTERLGARWQ